jgi:uncharacterized protein (DUF1697 family)
MPKYVALLRGISPLNPNMRMEKLRLVFRELGFKNVRTVITSGNVLFESPITNKKQLESQIEKAIHKELGFTSTTILRSDRQLKRLINKDPFRGKPDMPTARHHVTFLKRGGEVFSSIDIINPGGPNVMLQIEKEHGKEITTRTWKTVGRIVKELNKSIKKG